MGSKITGIFNILVGSFGIYMVGFRNAQFIGDIPKPIGFAVCGAIILYGLYLLVRKPTA